jgi:hypothetical protein
MAMTRRFTEATEIIRRLGAYEAQPVAAYAWRKAWLVRRDLLAAGLFSPSSPLRKIPGLRYGRLLGVAAANIQGAPVELPVNADAIQVGEPGSRLRSFVSREKRTLKVVRENSHYGPATRREIEWRGRMKRHPLLVPRLDAHEARDGYLFLHEELIEGRAFNLRRDHALLPSAVFAPLADFYEAFGLSPMPLDAALGPLTGFLSGSNGGWRPPAALPALLARNPSVSVSLCHNDLLPSNLAVTAKGVYFLDWGLASFSLCGRDFVKIGCNRLKNNGIRSQAAALVQRLHRGKLSLDELEMIEEAFDAYKKFHRNGRLDTGIAEPSSLDRKAAGHLQNMAIS